MSVHTVPEGGGKTHAKHVLGTEHGEILLWNHGITTHKLHSPDRTAFTSVSPKGECCSIWWKVTYLLDVTPSNPLPHPLSTPPIHFKLKNLVAKQHSTNTHTLTHACYACTHTWTHSHRHVHIHMHTCTYTQSYSSGVPEGDGLVSRAGAEGVREWQKPHCIHRVCMAPQCHHTLTTSMCAHGDKS